MVGETVQSAGINITVRIKIGHAHFLPSIAIFHEMLYIGKADRVAGRVLDRHFHALLKFQSVRRTVDCRKTSMVGSGFRTFQIFGHRDLGIFLHGSCRNCQFGHMRTFIIHNRVLVGRYCHRSSQRCQCLRQSHTALFRRTRKDYRIGCNCHISILCKRHNIGSDLVHRQLVGSVGSRLGRFARRADLDTFQRLASFRHLTCDIVDLLIQWIIGHDFRRRFVIIATSYKSHTQCRSQAHSQHCAPEIFLFHTH